jgi:surface protein
MSLIRKENGTICSTSVEDIGKTIEFEGETYFVACDGDERVKSSLKNVINNKAFTPINNIVVTHVTDMKKLFYNNDSFNEPLDKWDVSNVTTMEYMFCGCSLFNKPLNNWNVSKVRDMMFMFASLGTSCSSYECDCQDWKKRAFYDGNIPNCMSGVTMSFNQPLDKWDVSDDTIMYGMFSDSYIF